MLKPKTVVDADEVRAKLDARVADLRREAEGAEPDPFDEAMVAAVAGLAEALRVQASDLEAVGAKLGRVARSI